MISRKICLLGSVCVGKTSLARRFVYSSFSDKYQSTIGVKLHKKSLQVSDQDINLIVWDIQGEDRYDKVLVSYLKGLSGYILVVDVTQPQTVDIAIGLKNRVQNNFGQLPYVLVYSKCDLAENSATAQACAILEPGAKGVFRTSALTGAGVDDSFYSMASAIMPLSHTG